MTQSTTSAPCRFAFVSVGGPNGDITTSWLMNGDAFEPLDAGDQVDVTFSLPYKDATALLQGELAPPVAFMRGTMKTAGDLGKVLEILEATTKPAFAAWRATVLES